MLLLIAFIYNSNTLGLLNWFLPIYLMKWRLISSASVCCGLQARQWKMMTHWSILRYKLLCLFKNTVIFIVLILGVILRLPTKPALASVGKEPARVAWGEASWYHSWCADLSDMMSMWSCHIGVAACNCFLYVLSYLTYLSNAMLSICLILICHLKEKSLLFLARGSFVASRTMLWHEIHFVIFFPPTRPFISHSAILWKVYAWPVHDFACAYTSILQHRSPLPINQCLLSAPCPLVFLPWVLVELCPNCWKELCGKRNREGQNQAVGEYQPMQWSRCLSI